MNPVHAVVERAPLRRTLVLSGPADDFQRSELVRILDDVPRSRERALGGHDAQPHLPFSPKRNLPRSSALASGLLLAYLLELRARSNAGVEMVMELLRQHLAGDRRCAGRGVALLAFLLLRPAPARSR